MPCFFPLPCVFFEDSDIITDMGRRLAENTAGEPAVENSGEELQYQKDRGKIHELSDC